MLNFGCSPGKLEQEEFHDLRQLENLVDTQTRLIRCARKWAPAPLGTLNFAVCLRNTCDSRVLRRWHFLAVYSSR